MENSDQNNNETKIKLLERTLHDYLAENPNQIGIGHCKIIGREYVVDSGRIDLVVENLAKEIWAIELKIGIAGRDAIGQIASYVSALNDEFAERKVFGLLIASSFDIAAIRAHQSLRNIGLSTYKTHFSVSHYAKPIIEATTQPPTKIAPETKQKTLNYAKRRCPQCTKDNKYEVGSKHTQCVFCGYKFGIY